MHRAGHASADAALRYQHATRDRDRILAEALEKIVNPSSSSDYRFLAVEWCDHGLEQKKTRGHSADQGKEDSPMIFQECPLVVRASPPKSMGIHASLPTLEK
jgi:hypothetical protein